MLTISNLALNYMEGKNLKRNFLLFMFLLFSFTFGWNNPKKSTKESIFSFLFHLKQLRLCQSFG